MVSMATSSYLEAATRAPAEPTRVKTPPFVCVDVVVREHPRVEALDHVVAQLKALLDVSRVLSVAVAAQNQPRDSQSLSLLTLAAARETRKLSGWSSELVRNYRQYQFETALNEAAARGFFAGVRWLRASYLPKGKFHGAERAALYSGRLDMLRFLHDEFATKMAEDVAGVDSQDAVAHAAASGRLDLVRWYCEQKGPYAFGWSVMDAAVAQNHMDVVLYLDSHVGNRCTRRGLELAALNGHLDVVRWLNDTQYYEIRSFPSLENAIAGGHLHIVEYVLETVAIAQTSWMQAALTTAVAFGQRDILQWLHDRASFAAAAYNSRFRFEMTTTQLFRVAKDGHLSVLQWLHAHKYPVHCRRAHTVRGAIAGGHREILQWLESTFPRIIHQRHRIRVDDAVKTGDLAFVQWLVGLGYRLTAHAIDAAAANGYFQIVRWLHENLENPRCTKAAMDRAAANGHLEVVRFLHEHRKEGCTTAAMDFAARNGHLEVVEFLHANRSEYCTALAGETHSVGVLSFLKAKKRLRSRLPKTSEAAARGDLELLQWLYDHDRRNFGYGTVLEQAREGHHFHLLRWLETLPEAGRF